MEGSRTLPVITGALLLGLATDIGCSRSSDATSSNPWTVVTIRERRSGEIPFEEATGYLRRSASRNYVPGPDSLVARVVNDSSGSPHIVVQRMSTGQLDTLFAGWASLPQWSPDLQYISCVAWESQEAPYELTIIDVATRAVVVDSEANASGTMSKWSPDSRLVAASGVINESSWVMLYTVSIPDGKVAVLDSVDVLSSHEFSWSPDSRWIVFSRPTALDQGENVAAADLWVADARTGKTWPLLETQDWVEVNPLWITDRTIQVDRRRGGPEPASQLTQVVELLSTKE